MDTVLPLEQVLSPGACHALEQVGQGGESLFGQVEAALLSLEPGGAARPGGTTLRAWLAFLLAHAACTRTGVGLRQAQRRIKFWAGQSRRDLQLYVRAEQAFALVRQWGGGTLSDVAAQAGYSDQSHFGREVKRITGFSPAQFARRMQSDEAFWMYRLLDRHFQA